MQPERNAPSERSEPHSVEAIGRGEDADARRLPHPSLIATQTTISLYAWRYPRRGLFPFLEAFDPSLR